MTTLVILVGGLVALGWLVTQIAVAAEEHEQDHAHD